MNDTETVIILKALADINRLKIVKMLSTEEEMCGCRIHEAFDFSQPTLSHHMKVLCDAGIVKDVQGGKWHHYSVNKEKMEELFNVLRLY